MPNSQLFCYKRVKNVKPYPLIDFKGLSHYFKISLCNGETERHDAQSKSSSFDW